MSTQELLKTYQDALVTLRKLAELDTLQKSEHKERVASYESRIAELQAEQEKEQEQ